MKDEKIDDLQCRGLRIIQKKEGFRFGLDAVLLSSFADIYKNARVMDLGAGSGVIPILIAGKTEAKHITGIEIQEEIAQMAQRSVGMNNLDDRIHIMCGDIRNCTQIFKKSSFDVVVSNPPYINQGTGFINENDSKAISRHELKCTLEDVVKAASGLLKRGGQFAMVHKPNRLVDIVCQMRKYYIEPKYIQFVHPRPHKRANLLLIKGRKQGGVELKMLEPLYVYDESGDYSQQISNIYCKGVANIE